MRFESPEAVMRHAISIARHGHGLVEPNPVVGAVIVDGQLQRLAEGWHGRFGGPHAEVAALTDLQQRNPEPHDRQRLLANATLYVTLEPCCHFGKTPPCSQAVIDSGIRRVVYAHRDPSPHVDGGGDRQLREAGVDVTSGLLEEEAAALIAPFLKRVHTGLPWVHLKWAMTLDGRIAARTGASKWISSEASRAIVHELRGRMDAIIVGANTARIDDPLLTVRPPGPRTPLRIVVDSHASLSLDSQLVRTASDVPVVVATCGSADTDRIRTLRDTGVEVLPLEGRGSVNLKALLLELGRREMTNVLVEGGSGIHGAILDQRLADEVHVFVAPKIVGGTDAVPAVGGVGLDSIPQNVLSNTVEFRNCDGDVYVRALVQ